MLKKSLAFIKKDFLIESSYKLSFIFRIFVVLVSILTYFFIDRLFGHRIVGHLQQFGVNYFSYVLLSMAFFSYIGVGLGSFSNRIRFEQMQGTLEALLLTPTKVSFANVNILSALVILFLTIISFSSLGILSASFIMVFKRGNPVGWIINNLEGLIGGVYFPITIMPLWLQYIAHFFPITYAIRAVQLAVYRGYSLGQLQNEWVFLLLFSIILLPLSFSSFRYSLRKARQQGSLIQYS